jgi:SAM-dependent methyltransferase
MIQNKEEFEKLIREAGDQKFSGWDFSFLAGRMVETPPSWDYRGSVMEKIKGAKSLLDLDTGGGEFLETLQPFPETVCATEGHPPNLPLAQARLEPLGVKVTNTHAAMDLPFEDGAFDLVINRHGGILAAEIHRVLAPGGWFITQQVGDRNCIQLDEALQVQPDALSAMWTMDMAAKQLEDAGLRIVLRKEEFPNTEFKDVGAVVYFLKAIAWQVTDFTVEKYYDQLAEIHNSIQTTGGFPVQQHRFYIEAQKP